MTGFRIADPHINLVILEGLREGAGKDAAQFVCSDISSGSLFLRFLSDRLFINIGVHV